MKHNLTIFVLFIIIISLPLNILAQEYDSLFINAVRQRLTAEENKKLTTADDYITTGNLIMIEVDELDEEIDLLRKTAEDENLDEKTRNKILRKANRLSFKNRKKRIRAAKIYRSGYNELYRFFSVKIVQLNADSTDNQKQITAVLLNDAKVLFDSAWQKLKPLSNFDTDEILRVEISGVHEIKLDGMEKIEEALNITLGLTSPPVVSTIIPNIVPDTTQILTNEPDTVVPEKITFRVQVIAVSRKLQEYDLKTVYSGQANVFELKEDGLYKYAVGQFDNYPDARIFQRVIGGDSFIIALQDNEKIQITVEMQQGYGPEDY